MKFDDSSLTEYLVKHLSPLTEADPVILSEYVVALLKKDKSTKELQKLCTECLVEFLGQNTVSFTTDLFQAIHDGSIVRVDENLNAVENPESFHPAEMHQQKDSPDEDKCSSSSEPSSDPEEKELSEDDDRNHKHRRREARPHSLDYDTQEQPTRRPNRKRSKPYDNGHGFLEPDSQTSGSQKGYNPSLANRRHPFSGPPRGPFDPRARPGQAFRNDFGPRIDSLSSVGRPPVGRGRGRNVVPWNHNDLRFSSPLDPRGYASRMASQGSGHPNLFVGAGFRNSTGAQNPSWSGFGYIPGMTNGILDPLGMNGTLQSTITPPLNIGMPRQRCRDFEEQGFCLRGDMCPMEHGLNRIVVEDVQSLSQFNLPLSIPSSNTSGGQVGSGPSITTSAPSSLLTNIKGVPGKPSKSEVMDLVKPNGTSGGDDEDVYDPDQPLWSTGHPNTSSDLLMLPSSDVGDKALWDADASESDRRSLRLFGDNNGAKRRADSKFKSETGSKSSSILPSTNHHGNETKEVHKETIVSSNGSNLYNSVSSTEAGFRTTTMHSGPRSYADSEHRSYRPLSKASCTLRVYGIPQTANTWKSLLSHFKKFGKVVHIYIPPNSDKAFVQFTKKEEAESALKSPEAVMGNRFIKLSWANHDRIPVEVQNKAHAMSEEPSSALGSVSSQQLVADGRKVTHPSSQQRSQAASISTSETPISVPGHRKVLPTPIPAHPASKKVENSDILEEIRKKQELLDKKRDEFRRQLEKIEKKTVSVKKGEAVSEQSVKRLKIDVSSDATKAAADCRTSVSSPKCQGDQRTLERRTSEEVLASPTSKPHSSTLQQSRKNMNKTNFTTPPLNRFKLDNRSTSFRILPPLPADFANVTMLKEHFSRFGVISSVLLEEPEANTESAGPKSSDNFSAFVSFANRHAAEKAYQSGKCWEGHNLHFKWVSSNLFGTKEATRSDQNSEIQVDIVASASTPVSSEIAAAGNEEPSMDIDSAKSGSVSQVACLLPTSESISMMSLGEMTPGDADEDSNVT